MKSILLIIIYFLFIQINAQTQIGNTIEGITNNDFLGEYSFISKDGNTMVLGYPYANGVGLGRGMVKVFRLKGNKWLQLGSDIFGLKDNDAMGRSIAISEDGNTIATCSGGRDSNGVYRRGIVEVFQYNSGWRKIGDGMYGEYTDDWSGLTLDLSNDGKIVAIGTSRNNSHRGHVRIYKFINGAWTQLGIDLDGEGNYDKFAVSLCLNNSGDKIIIGGYYNDGGGIGQGHARVFHFVNGSWVQQGSDIDGKVKYEFSGETVSMSSDGNIVAVGSPRSAGAYVQGIVRVFEYKNNNWVQLGKDILGEGQIDNSGMSISISDDGKIIAIGAPNNDGATNGYRRGHVRIYKYTDTSWKKIGIDIDGEYDSENFGSCVSLTGNGKVVLSGSPNYSVTGTSRGCVKVFKLFPELQLKGNNEVIVSGNNVPRTLDKTDYGTLNLNDSLIFEYKLFNIGSDTLFFSNNPNISISGTNSSDFIIDNYLPSFLNIGDSIVFKIKFKPSSSGNKNAKITIFTTMIKNSNLFFNIKGKCIGKPRIEVLNNNYISINNNDTLPSNIDSTIFGKKEIGGYKTIQYKIKNTGNDLLTFSGKQYEIIGENNIDFSSQDNFPYTLNPKDSILFNINFSPSKLGKANAMVYFFSNDENNDTFKYKISGIGYGKSEIAIFNNKTKIINNDTINVMNGITDFDSVILQKKVFLSFKIKNIGNDTLDLSNDSIFVTNSFNFNVTNNLPVYILPGDSFNFNIFFHPNSIGLKSANLCIINKLNRNNKYIFKIIGVGIKSNIELKQNNILILENENITNFGNTRVNGGEILKSFMLYNKGNDTIRIISKYNVYFLGKNAADFTFSKYPIGLLHAKDSLEFKVLFNPSDTGNRLCQMKIILNNDSNNFFVYFLKGKGIEPEIQILSNNHIINNNDNSPSFLDNTNFGNIAIGKDKIIEYLVKNIGNDTLKFLGNPDIVTLSNNNFEIINKLPNYILKKDSALFSIKYKSTILGNIKSSVVILSNDYNESNFNFDIEATSNLSNINLIDNSKKIILYPNPVKNTINIIFSNTLSFNNTVSVQIFDVYGKEMNQLSNITIENNTESFSIDVSQLEAGDYIIKLLSDNGNYFFKFSKL